MNENSRSSLDKALEFVASGGLIGLPTETVYGLAAPIDSQAQIERIFTLKERPFFDPLIVHVSSVEMAKSLVLDWPVIADKLAQKFWPGPLTLVLPKKPEKVSDLITSGLKTVGLRAPNHPLALEFIKKLDRAVAAPSANKFTQTSPTKADHVVETFSANDVFVLDGGDCQVGVESTILSIEDSSIHLLRPGMITKDQLQDFLRRESFDVQIRDGLTKLESEAQQVPGGSSIHYRPPWPVITARKKLEKADWHRVVKSTGLSETDWVIRKLNSNVLLAARELYALLRSPLPKGASGLIVELPTLRSLSVGEQEQWQTLHDRLKKASLFQL